MCQVLIFMEQIRFQVADRNLTEDKLIFVFYFYFCFFVVVIGW